jgi:hypothetical protein
MHTGPSQEHGLGECPLIGNQNIPQMTVSRIIRRLAGIHTSVAANACLQIYTHGPVGLFAVGLASGSLCRRGIKRKELVSEQLACGKA